MAGTMAKEMIDLWNDCFILFYANVHSLSTIPHLYQTWRTNGVQDGLPCLFDCACKLSQVPIPPRRKCLFSCAGLWYAIAIEAGQGVGTVDPYRGQAKHSRRNMVVWK